MIGLSGFFSESYFFVLTLQKTLQMAYSKPIKEIITYPPEALRSFSLVMYEWIDNLDFTLAPDDYLANADAYINIARELFSAAGWDGDGDIRLMWIPPFMFSGVRTAEFTVGVIVWHVKQQSDGLSWILSPVELPCESEFE